jgi:hypothetical protein
MTRRKPLDPDLYAAVVDEAKARFAVWPSAYASGWVVKTYKARGGRYAGQGRKESTGLTKWFGESWVDLSRPTADGGYEPCGRKRSDAPFDAAHYPKCRPLKEALRMSPDEVTDAVRRKRRAEASAPGRGSRARAPKRVATYRENPLPPQAVESDLLDAIEHADVYGDQGWTLDDFDVRYVGPKSLSAIRQYEDWGGWIDTAPEDYADLSPEERLAQLEGFRGKKWAERAAHWYATGKVPPVVAIEAPIVSEDQLDWQLGDGRGRINFALAMGLRTLPVIEMRWKGARANPEGIDGDALAAWCASDESYAVLDETASAGSSWMAGACVLLAKALVAMHPEAQLVGLEVDGDVQHVGALVGDVVYDALGAHDERAWARDWLAYEQLDPRTPARLVSLPPGVPASVLPDVEAPATTRDVRLVARALPA